jgi:hypothetical protein
MHRVCRKKLAEHSEFQDKYVKGLQ